MAALIFFLLNLGASIFKPKSRLAAENAALRQQLVVLQRQLRGRAQFTNSDRLERPPISGELRALIRRRCQRSSVSGRTIVMAFTVGQLGAAALALQYNHGRRSPQICGH
jgi:hypothetical protein